MTVSGTPASTSCRATPSPQSITYAALFVTITCADAELTLRGRGPPPVPRRMSLVRLCTLTDRERATAPAIVVARNPRRLMVAKSQRFYRHLRHSTNGRRWGAGLFGIRTASKCFNTLRAHTTDRKSPRPAALPICAPSRSDSTGTYAIRRTDDVGGPDCSGFEPRRSASTRYAHTALGRRSTATRWRSSEEFEMLGTAGGTRQIG